MARLFTKTIEPCCAYCERATLLGENGILCDKKGVVPSEGHCRAFRYDPLKRIPPKPASADFSKLKDEDFSL